MPRNRKIPRRRRRRGFSIVELLTAVLIISILMSVALPLYLNAMDDSQRKACRTNMVTIANAVVAARFKARSADFGALIAAGVTTSSLPDLLKVPTCPNGGTYTLANGSSATTSTFQVKCNVTYPTTHGKFEPGIDSN